ncbi:MAG: elongation factor EF-2 [Candidatus Aenigmarchaeota archaeon]|nr:elongation factor EF-2 [Candidatus Aenigmarchaeota archaeon]
MAKKGDLTQIIKVLMRKHENIRNIGIVAHIDHGKTTLSDNLLAGAGMISEELSGKQCAMDFDAQEQERGITIFAANVSMVHEYKGNDFLINLIDTPGHVDFGGDVTRAMRAVDGAVILTDAVEGCMPQTETVVRQALKERVRPILFINKVDRYIKELKLTPEQMQQQFMKIIAEVNALISKYAEPEYKTKWMVNVNDGSVAFGSAYRNWAISVPYMKEKGISFKDIIEMTNAGPESEKELAKKAPLHEILLDAVIKHLPNPDQAQKYRVPKIWPGDNDSEAGKDMIMCNPDGKLGAVVTKLYPDPHAGYVATVRIFSGKVKVGTEVYLVGTQKKVKIQQVSLYKGQQRVPMEEVNAGNIVGLVGLKDASSGETLCDPDDIIVGFESIKHIFEPVVTKAIEPKKPQQLAKLIEFLRRVSKEDPTLQIVINEDTGEYLVSGLGELQIDAKIERPLKEAEIDVSVSPPIVIFKESVSGSTKEPIEGKSPNKHNRFYFLVEPLEKAVFDAMVAGELPSDSEMKKKDVDFQEKLVKLGFDRDESKKVKLIHNRNMLIDATSGVQAILEVMEMIKESFKEAMDNGPLAREPCSGIKVKLVDAKLHEDAIHRGPAQVIPAVRSSIRLGMVNAKAYILEPKQMIRIDVPIDHVSGALKEVSNRRGQVIDMTDEQGATVIKAKLPVAEMFGFNSALKSSTGGMGFFWLIDVIYEALPKELELKYVTQIKQRKGITDLKNDESEEEA